MLTYKTIIPHFRLPLHHTHLVTPTYSSFSLYRKLKLHLKYHKNPSTSDHILNSKRKTSIAMAANQQVQLLGFLGSPFVARAELALKLKGIQYEYIQESLTDKSERLLKNNPVHKKVPVLLINDKPICESLVIAEYVDEAWSGYPILPSDPYHRALSRFWSKFIEEKVLPAAFKAAWNPNKQEREKGAEEAREALKVMENELKVNGKFFSGDSVGFLEIAALIIFYWLPIIQEASEFDAYSGDKYPKLDKWGQEIVNDSVVIGVLPPRDVLLNFFKSMFQSIVASK